MSLISWRHCRTDIDSAPATDADGVLHSHTASTRGSPDGFHPGPFGVRGRETEHMGQQFEEMPRAPGRRRVNVMRCAGVVMVIAVVLSTAFKAMPA